MARRGDKKPLPETGDPDGLDVWTRRYLEHLAERNYSDRTVGGSEAALRLFIVWALDRGLVRPAEITKPILEHYQRWLFHYRKPSGKPLTFVSQRDRLQKLRNFFRFLTRQSVLLSNPASELELPRVERRLPRDVLTAGEMEKVLAQPDLSDPLGLRDRAMMEVFYSTGLRRNELTSLDLFDLDPERGALMIRLGKGKKDRIVPIGERAIAWVRRYLDSARAELAVSDAERAIFLSEQGGRLDPGYLTHLMGEYIEKAKVNKRGACHIFRHTMATLMLERGADVPPHPGDPRSRRDEHDRDLHPGLDPAPQARPRRHAPGREARHERFAVARGGRSRGRRRARPPCFFSRRSRRRGRGRRRGGEQRRGRRKPALALERAVKRSHYGEERASRPLELARGGAVSVFSRGAVGLGRSGSGRLEGMSTTAEDILKQVRALPERERLRLVERIVHEVAERMPKQPAKPPLADLTDDEFRELQGAIEEARSMPLRTPE